MEQNSDINMRKRVSKTTLPFDKLATNKLKSL